MPRIAARELWRRLNRIGYITQEQAAEALGLKQYNLNRYLSGARSIPGGVARTLELLEEHPVVVLSGTMRMALEGAAGPGAQVAYPEGEGVHISRVDWDAVFEAMFTLGIITYQGRTPVLTERGWAALQKEEDTDAKP